MSTMPTLEELRREARRVFGNEFIELHQQFSQVGSAHVLLDGVEVVLMIRPRLATTYFGRSKAAARRFAIETLRSMPSKESST